MTVMLKHCQAVQCARIERQCGKGPQRKLNVLNYCSPYLGSTKLNNIARSLL